MQQRYLEKLQAVAGEKRALALDQSVLKTLQGSLSRAQEIFYQSGIFKERKGLIGYKEATREQIEKRLPLPQLNYKQRGKIAGSAYLENWEIRLNPVLLAENGEQFIKEVVPHELAHLLTFRLFGKVPPHGREWRWMMEKVLGVPARRTHSFDVKSVQGRSFTYRCGCKTHDLSIIRHNRVMRKRAQYHCRQCGEILNYIGEENDMKIKESPAMR